ncbi:Hypothetical predicted protein [Mytilus galloprovincialis]|uniref:Uncharacterized protein n=1 Tax=Mytilus galloprovincialis TaxID=29158 RepID=A0A8B6DR39_MYTGA|nr:Hypothetical predicted protein [Mytilus galloprovincialis]
MTRETQSTSGISLIRSKALLGSQEQEAASLLREYGDVFAASEFDLGNFSAIEYQIDTAGHPPIKQRMRRTPIGFAQEEETHLKKMLEAGVIQPSVSEWCSAPVLEGSEPIPKLRKKYYNCQQQTNHKSADERHHLLVNYMSMCH